jgi:hypothetical protein
MITADLSQKIDLLPQEEYSLVEEYVERISEYVVKKQQEKAWSSIKEDLNRAEESIKNEGTISYADLRKKLGV